MGDVRQGESALNPQRLKRIVNRECLGWLKTRMHEGVLIEVFYVQSIWLGGRWLGRVRPEAWGIWSAAGCGSYRKARPVGAGWEGRGRIFRYHLLPAAQDECEASKAEEGGT